jgi:hypothetical protein
MRRPMRSDQSPWPSGPRHSSDLVGERDGGDLATSPTRVKALPEVPTVAEGGYKNDEMDV